MLTQLRRLPRHAREIRHLNESRQRGAGVDIQFSGNHQGFARAFDRLIETLDQAQLDDRCRYNVELVFEEIISNIIHYGAVDRREPNICVLVETRDDRIILVFEDDGIPFDSTTHSAPPPSQSLDEARLGGFGLTLVRGAASSLSYQRTAAGRNRLTAAVTRTPSAT